MILVTFFWFASKNPIFIRLLVCSVLTSSNCFLNVFSCSSSMSCSFLSLCNSSMFCLSSISTLCLLPLQQDWEVGAEVDVSMTASVFWGEQGWNRGWASLIVGWSSGGVAGLELTWWGMWDGLETVGREDNGWWGLGRGEVGRGETDWLGWCLGWNKITIFLDWGGEYNANN